MTKKAWYTGIAAVGVAVLLAAAWLPKMHAAKRAAAGAVSVGSDDIGGVVTSSKGPEAGVWVIAETTDLPTKYVKIVVTDDSGRYLVPELPKANYKVWVRGYGLVDSSPVQATPGKDVDLTAKIAPDATSGGAILSGGLLVFAAEAAGEERFSGNRADRQRHRAGDEEPGPVDRSGEGEQLRSVPPDRRQGHARTRAGAGAFRYLRGGLGTPRGFGASGLADERRACAHGARSARWECMRTGPTGSPRANIRSRRRRGRRASSATS